MLSSLHIENVALIKEVTLIFNNGFTVLTGETGAGKSIIIDALSLLCGGRSDRELIRGGELYAFVEGVFDGFSGEVLSKLGDLDIKPEEDGTLFISRRVSADGKSAAKINERPVPLSKLKTVAELLLNIHGQQDTMLLADRAKHLPLIDAYASSEGAHAKYKKLYEEYTSVSARLKDAKAAMQDSAFKKEMLTFKIDELEKASLKKGEEEELLQLRVRLRSAEKIAENASKAYSLLYGGDGAVSEKLYRAMGALSSLSDALPEAKTLNERLDGAKCEIDDIADSLRGLSETDVDSASERLDKTETRLETISSLKRRHNVDFEGLLELRTRLEDELSGIENIEGTVLELETAKAEALKALVVCGEELSAVRKAASDSLEKRVAGALEGLDMPSVRFTVRFEPVAPGPDGCDEAEFLLSPNAGEPLKPLAKIASGGELARIMLALKSVLSEADGVSVMVFDEIDTGISGKTAQKTGLALKNLTKQRAYESQVFCVTHSAQIAALADTHVLVRKEETDGRTLSMARALDDVGRVTEIARIIGGINIGEAALNAAREMLAEGKKL